MLQDMNLQAVDTSYCNSVSTVTVSLTTKASYTAMSSFTNVYVEERAAVPQARDKFYTSVTSTVQQYSIWCP